MLKAPEMGQHTSEVLAEMGYSEAEITAFQEQGIV
jgi:crotonobetainyl-CoA:carnitine CoA-transferase CaiB-like acyl-CoA transferase